MSDITLDTPDKIAMGQWAAQVSALAMKHGGLDTQRPGFVRRVADSIGSPKRTSAGVCEDLILAGYAAGGQLTSVWSTVERNLGTKRTTPLRRKAERIRKQWLEAQK